ncbi:cob(I)yrinic acid a,c-diamide adenosyltransferase [Methanolacinia petrolearia]|uniref:cob(I)yrinic acid a,c-diamide adenosyltransferase n=1 Tax=Methanolacinia petrolearia TaxID=54120 RepID=UPI0011D15C2F|nr:cob(I)yrinic acid a,c-diamide adenosyltransferase [Methanolacinia petrolearia]
MANPPSAGTVYAGRYELPRTRPGKTTAALGISLRTLVSGGNVFFGQFMKGLNTA